MESKSKQRTPKASASSQTSTHNPPSTELAAAPPPVEAAPEFMATRQFCAYVGGIAEVTAENWRSQGKGPAFIRLSKRAIRYRKSDVDAWLSARRIGGAE